MTAPPVIEPRTVTRWYGFSALLTGLARLGRAPLAFLVAIVANAAVQAVLVLPGTVPGTSVLSWLLALVSLAALVLAAALATAAGLGAVTGRMSLGASVASAARHLGRFALWCVLLSVAVTLGLALFTVPGLLVAAVTPYVLLAASDGRGNALVTDLRAIAQRPGRWLATALIMGAVLLVSWLVSALSGFFVGGAVSAFVSWLWFGFLFCWFTCAWAVVYRSTPVGAPAGPGPVTG